MKTLLLVTSAALLLNSCCARTSTTAQPTIREEPLTIESALLDEQYALSTVQVLEMPLADNRYILAKHEDTAIEIRNAAEFSPIVTEIASPEDALALVRLITSEDIRPFLQGVYYHEVHKKSEPETDDPLEILKSAWFAIEPEQYEEWEISDPVVTEDDDEGYTIERFVASYPQIIQTEGEEPQETPAQLLKIKERVTVEGDYDMEILDVITEGDPIHKILYFTK